MIGLFTIELLGAENKIRCRLAGVKHIITIYPESIAGKDGNTGLPWTIERQIAYQLNIPKKVTDIDDLVMIDHPTKEDVKIPVMEDRSTEFHNELVEQIKSLSEICFDSGYHKNCLVRCDNFNEMQIGSEKVTCACETDDQYIKRIKTILHTEKVKAAYAAKILAEKPKVQKTVKVTKDF